MPIIYKITSPSGRVYVGSTKRKLRERWAVHKGLHRLWKAGGHRYCSSYLLFDETGNPDDCKCEVLEHIEDLGVLKERERHWVESIGAECVNDRKPYVTAEEIRAKNAGHFRAKYATNREEILAKQAVKVTCECGAIHRMDVTAKHKRTHKHQAYIASLAAPTGT